MTAIRKTAWRLIGRPLFRLSPHPLYGFRRFLLRLAGMRFGHTVRFRRSVDIDCPWNVAVGDLTMIGDGVLIRAACPIVIGSRCVISQYCSLLTEARDAGAPGSPPTGGLITIGDDCWLATDTLVLPESTLEPGVVVGARAMVKGRLPSWRIATGEPAVARRERVLHAAT